MMKTLKTSMGWVKRRFFGVAEKALRAVPGVNAVIEKQYESLMAPLETSLKPYRNGFTSFSRLPPTGRDRDEVLREMETLKSAEQSRWQDGFVSGGVYHGDQGFVDFLGRVYALHSQSNPLHSDVWPSASKFESEIVSMTANMLGASVENGEVCGCVSSGGTESILLAVKTYRDSARDQKGISRPEIVAPATAHPAFDKAAQYFQVEMRRVPVGSDFRADVAAMRSSLTRNTILVVGSAPSYPHGVIDPIADLSELARERKIGFHTDCCLGGFILPWAEKPGYTVPPFDFRLGVRDGGDLAVPWHGWGYAEAVYRFVVQGVTSAVASRA
jgi:glutamate/tyrosine decarboxylase-like PLP-dependent enzyme